MTSAKFRHRHVDDAAEEVIEEVRERLNLAGGGSPTQIALEYGRLLNEELEQLATCAGYVIDAVRENGDDPVELALKQHYGFEGMEFSVMRAKWMLGERDDAFGMHHFVGEHSPEKCPVCVGDKAFGSPLLRTANSVRVQDPAPSRVPVCEVIGDRQE